MIIAVRLGGPLRAWHRRLADGLEAAGHRVAIAPGPSTRGVIDRVLATERWLYRIRSNLFEPVEWPSSQDVGEPDLRIRLDAAADIGGADLRPTFDGVAGEAALIAALLAGRAPKIEICAGDRVLSRGLPAVEDPLVISRALDNVLARLVTLILQAVGARDGAAGPAATIVKLARPVSAARVIARGVAGKVGRKLGPAKGRPNHWRIAYRLGGDQGVAGARAWPSGGFTPLQDDGTRFYADPFPFVHDGRRFIFFEDFPYATARGVIGVVEIDAKGSASAPRRVLEVGVHLSYPFLLRDGGEIYMLPEMSGARHIQLYRADPFPDRWVPDRILIDNIAAGDATIVRHADRFWMFATLSEPGESTWDQLAIFNAPSLFGPWVAHVNNPVLIDAGAARPAGAMWHEDGVLMRVAQDCRGGYGAGLAICRVDCLDATGFAQTVVRHLGPPTGFGAGGAHTLNRCGDLEVIDLRVPHSR